MNWKHFLGVLLTGGSLATGCGEGARSSALEVTDGAPSLGADAGGDSGGDAAQSDGAPAEPCLCSPTRCCDQHAGGPATVQMGLVCCWGTSC